MLDLFDIVGILLLHQSRHGPIDLHTQHLPWLDDMLVPHPTRMDVWQVKEPTFTLDVRLFPDRNAARFNLSLLDMEPAKSGGGALTGAAAGLAVAMNAAKKLGTRPNPAQAVASLLVGGLMGAALSNTQEKRGPAPLRILEDPKTGKLQVYSGTRLLWTRAPNKRKTPGDTAPSADSDGGPPSDREATPTDQQA